jgi:hypothetical protein
MDTCVCLLIPLLVGRCLFDPLHAHPGPYRRVRRSQPAAPRPMQDVSFWTPRGVKKVSFEAEAEPAKRSYSVQGCDAGNRKVVTEGA